jgi:hypothetical protein
MRDVCGTDASLEQEVCLMRWELMLLTCNLKSTVFDHYNFVN